MNEFSETHKMMIMNYFCGIIGRQKTLNLISAGIRVRDSHHCKSPTLCNISEWWLHIGIFSMSQDFLALRIKSLKSCWHYLIFTFDKFNVKLLFVKIKKWQLQNANVVNNYFSYFFLRCVRFTSFVIPL